MDYRLILGIRGIGDKMPGRKPKPAALEKLEGNPTKRKIKKEIAMPLDMPDSPQPLDEYALEEWNRLAHGLNAVGVLSRMDMGVMAAYCDSYSQWRRATELLRDILHSGPGGNLLSLVQIDKTGLMVKNPLTERSDKAKADMVKYAAELGMTPVARARIAVEGKPQKSKFSGLIGVEKK